MYHTHIPATHLFIGLEAQGKALHLKAFCRLRRVVSGRDQVPSPQYIHSSIGPASTGAPSAAAGMIIFMGDFERNSVQKRARMRVYHVDRSMFQARHDLDASVQDLRVNMNESQFSFAGKFDCQRLAVSSRQL